MPTDHHQGHLAACHSTRAQLGASTDTTSTTERVAAISPGRATTALPAALPPPGQAHPGIRDLA
eukprot:3857791-Prorocentrum_lima.AAC.1